MKKAGARLLLMITGFFFILAFQNCGKPTTLQYDDSASLGSNSVEQSAALKVLTANCYECHQPTNSQGNVMDITNTEYLVFAGLVVPGQPENSPLYQQIDQGLMPKNGPVLSAEDMEIISNWIVSLDPNATPDPGDPGPSAPKFADIYSQIIQPKCVACHSSRYYKLNSYAAVMQTVSAGNATSSLLYESITVGRTGGKMPMGGSMTSAEIQAVKDWINAGALNN